MKTRELNGGDDVTRLVSPEELSRISGARLDDILRFIDAGDFPAQTTSEGGLLIPLCTWSREGEVPIYSSEK